MADKQISVGLLLKILGAVGGALSVVILGLNMYFLPRSTHQEHISQVRQELAEQKRISSITMNNVAWIREVWEQGIKASKDK